MEQTLLTVREAYAAMFVFWEKLYGVSKSDDIGSFLGSMSLLSDNTPTD